jgi:hypothetical protein
MPDNPALWQIYPAFFMEKNFEYRTPNINRPRIIMIIMIVMINKIIFYHNRS